MLLIGLFKVLLLLLLIGEQEYAGSLADAAAVTSEGRLPIVYVYTVVPAVCKYGLPMYIRSSLEQAVLSQPDCDIIMASNFADCEEISKNLGNLSSVIQIDISSKYSSEKTKLFANVSRNMFEIDYGSELWLTSALRFFNLEDLMIQRGYTEMIHVEADNLLYGSMSELLPILRKGYKNSMAATPLNSNKSFITASVLWISSLLSLQKFNAFLLGLGTNTHGEWKGYLTWIRPYGCCKHGGIDPDANGNGIRPYAINEMSMLAYYHYLFPKDFLLFPVTPLFNYVLNRHICNLSEFGPDGREAGEATGNGIWDPNSWGQFLGGTATKRGRDKGFTDSSHIAGQAMRTNMCRPHMLCIPKHHQMRFYDYRNFKSADVVANNSNNVKECILAPHVRCGTLDELLTNVSYINQAVWSPLWNLHVHSKHTQDFMSRSCACP
jgi:hypothetical protein